ncbi:hypothetical protein [Streptomyces sp. NPDC048269]|uniref:hypothetical protein n=1 Tax=Streptomyces sp. NPDC048269 TaxID=3155753 RepID=UPI003422EBAB
MSLPSGSRSGEVVTGQSRARTPGLPRLVVGPYAADESQLLKEALDVVCARPEIAEQMSVLQVPPDLEGVVNEHRDVIRLNVADQQERARQLGNRLDELLVAEMASDPGRLATFTKLSEAADGLRYVADALAEVIRGSESGQRVSPDGVREVLSAAWSRRSAAAELSSNGVACLSVTCSTVASMTSSPWNA